MKAKRKKKIKKVIKLAITILAFFLLCYSGYKAVTFFLQSNLFAINKIRTNLGKTEVNKAKELELFEQIANKSLFLINRKKIIKELEKEYPEYKKFIVQKKFPHTLYINFVKREPLFQLNITGSYYLLDKEHIIISGAKKEPYEGVVLVRTLISRGLIIEKGKHLGLSYADYINSLINFLKKFNFFKKYNISSLSVFNPNGIRFDLRGVDIRLGSNEFSEKLRILDDSIFPRFKKDLNNIAYIDLRFDDYVVGYKK